jgi:type I site-specific restriction-modification system R (restriction) subunit
MNQSQSAENIIEQSAIEEFSGGRDGNMPMVKKFHPEGLFCERESFNQILLINRLRSAIAQINPGIPPDAQEAALQKGIAYRLS